MSEISDKHPIEGLMAAALKGLKDIVDVNTIVGDPITTPDGTLIMPISKVGLGFGVGGSEFPKSKKLLSSADSEENQSNLFGGGTGGGLSLSPVGFLVVGSGKIRMVPVSEENSIYERLIDAVPTAIDKISEIVSSSRNKTTVVSSSDGTDDDGDDGIVFETAEDE